MKTLNFHQKLIFHLLWLGMKLQLHNFSQFGSLPEKISFKTFIYSCFVNFLIKFNENYYLHFVWWSEIRTKSFETFFINFRSIFHCYANFSLHSAEVVKIVLAKKNFLLCNYCTAALATLSRQSAPIAECIQRAAKSLSTEKMRVCLQTIYYVIMYRSWALGSDVIVEQMILRRAEFRRVLKIAVAF